MIAFACPHCGAKLSVKPHFAGRTAPCPACKQRLTVPAADTTRTYAPAGQLDGTASSLAQAGLDPGVTLAASGPVPEVLARRTQKGQRYSLGGEIARGGMGAVLRAVDCDIRREVAIKYMLDQSDAHKKLRFVEEAQITGQLEHPNIVPIHELGVDSQKRLFFAMKMVKGRSLAQVIEDLRQTPRSAEKDWSLNRLLNIFVNVCHALAYAHARNVIHRDLKPANIMVGDFGEVYVMDWGLAKVLASGGREPPVEGIQPQGAPSTGGLRPPLAGSVQTSREPEADLTQEGAVLGTPVYMPPEQAAGRIGDIDQRSDVYSLGAILYELLTLQQPIDKEGGYLSVLMRVAEGEIVPPEQRDPQRAKAGKIPRELAAVAMKALAKKREDRYPSVEELRRDIERFQEGRSVSAKQDTTREILWKLVKRNKAVSAVLFVLLPALVVLLGFGLTNYWAFASEQKEKNKRTTEAVPALVVSARLMANEGQFKEALKQMEVVFDYDPANAEVRLLRGQVLMGQKDFAAGRAELEAYLKQRPGDADAQQLAALCATGKTDDPAILFGVATVFQRQKVFGLAARLLQDVQVSTEARRRLLPLYQKQINAAWPGLGQALIVDNSGFSLNLTGRELTVLDPLKGIPLQRLVLQGNPVRDLTPLQGMPLTYLSLMHCRQVRDLTPLHGMPLAHLDLKACGPVSDLSPLHGMPLTTLDLSECGQVRDLTPLHGMSLASLNLGGCGQVRDLSPLRGMPLTSLNLWSCGQVRDLSPLQGMSLISLQLISCKEVQDLTPLQGLNLTEVLLTPRFITKSMDVLRRMKSLKTLGIGGGANEMFPAAEFWKKYDAGEFK